MEQVKQQILKILILRQIFPPSFLSQTMCYFLSPSNKNKKEKGDNTNRILRTEDKCYEESCYFNLL